MTTPTDYEKLQAEAKLLGINPNQKKDILAKAIGEVTAPEYVATLMELNGELGKEIERIKAIPTIPGPDGSDLAEVAGKIINLHEAQLSDKSVHTDPYMTGLANGLLMARGVIKNEDISDQLIKPSTDVAIKGAKPMTNRERLIKELGKYVTLASGTGRLRTGLTPDDIKEADEIMKALGYEKGEYTIPKE